MSDRILKRMTYKPLVFFCMMTLAATTAFGQAPVISHIDKYITGNGQRVTISGSNFGTSITDIVVWFGAAKGNVLTVSDQTIEVNVPPGATIDNISVTHATANRTASSEGQFQLSYGGDQPLALANLVAQTDLGAETGLYDVCLCDFDNDGSSDVAGSSGGASTPFGISVFRNLSLPGGPFSFSSKVSLLPATKALNVKCADLNGDGKKDIIVTEVDPGNRVFILRNTSVTGSLSFASSTIVLTGKSPKRVEAADLDMDGRPELIITDQNTANKDLLILPNTSTGGAISFGVFTTLLFPGTGTDGVAVQDINADNKPDIIVSQVLSTQGNVYVYQNKSSEGNILFHDALKTDISPASPNNTGAPINLRVGDIDGDTKPDIIVTKFFSSFVTVLRNLSSSSAIQFSAPVNVPTDVFPFGLDIGDMNGDGKPEIVVASLTGPLTDPNPKSLSILNNTSTPGNISFAAQLIQPTTFVNRHIVVGDIDGDSKPDLLYTSVDDNTRGVPASKISFFRNKSCITPKIDPAGPLTICTSFPLTLNGTVAPGATYQWKLDGIVIPAATTSSFTPLLSGDYTLELTSDACLKTSNIVNVTMVPTGSAATPTVSSTSPYCVGATVSLSANTAGATDYKWIGPGGFTATGTAVTRPSYVPAFAGRYDVDVYVGTCIAAKGSVLVETISLPLFTLGFAGSDIICDGDSKMLSVSPNDPDFNYQWADANGEISGATGPTLSINNTGAYSFKATSVLYPGCPEVQTEAVDFKKVNLPNVAFTAPTETCKDSPVLFNNQSVLDADAGANYKWEFGDAATSTEVSPTHAYTVVNTLNVKLTASYRGNACPEFVEKTIKINLAPSVSITTPGGIFKFCEGDKLPVAVNGTFAEYDWNNDATTATTDITTGGTISVKVKTGAGCQVTATKSVTMLPAPVIAVTATPPMINLGETSTLNAAAGFTEYLWTPAETLDNDDDASPVATPKITTTYTVTAKNADGCKGTGSFELVVIVDNPINLLRPANFLSPNDDGTNQTWLVENMENFEGCGVTIFDAKGVKLYESKPYGNDWDGTANGKKVPDGVYYYLIRCDGDSSTKTGSITLIR